MKRTFALVILLASLAVLIKLAAKPNLPDILPGSASTVGKTERAHAGVELFAKDELLARYHTASPRVREMVARLAERFGRTADAIDRTDGERGLVLLDRLDMEALFLYEKYPREFHRLRDLLGAEAAADLLLHWREYFGLKRADETDRGTLIAEIASLTPAQLRVASRYPAALPLILAEPQGVTALIDRMAGDPTALADVLTVLSFISLEPGASDLRSALRTFEHFGPIAIEAYRLQGLEGFAMVSLYGSVFEGVGNALPLEQSMILARVNSQYLDELLQTHRPEMVAGHLRHVAAVGPGGIGGRQSSRIEAGRGTRRAGGACLEASGARRGRCRLQ